MISERRILFFFPVFILAVLGSWCPAQESRLNALSETEQKAGWKMLFDGKTLNGWRAYGKPSPPSHAWKIENGVLTHLRGAKQGDMMTVEVFDDFEFSWEWSMPPESNSGIKYFITEERKATIGHEYQMIDDRLVTDHDLSSCGSFYLVVAPKTPKPLKPWGEWNHSRVIVQGNHVEHWLNGEKLLEYTCGDPKILAQVDSTKFKGIKDFGRKVPGHILLTSHNDQASFRNLKIRRLPMPK